MARTEQYFESINATDSDEVVLHLLIIDHADLPEPIRVVNNTENVTHQGNEYIGVPFAITLPDQQEQGASKASITVDNVGRTLTDWLEVSSGGVGATVEIIEIISSDPDHVQANFKLNLSDVNMTVSEVSGTLSYTDIFNKPGIVLTYSPAVTPGVF